MKVPICRVAVDAVRMDEVVTRVARAVTARRAGLPGRPLVVFSANVDMVVRAERDPIFADELVRADLLLPDGVPLLWMARALGTPLPERVAGADLVPRLAAFAAGARASLFFLGAAPGVADRAALRLARAFPGVGIAGVHAPAAGFDADPAHREAAIAAVRASRADVVLVALGAPRQERFILAERDRLGTAALVAVGGALDMIAGDRPRAPRLLQRVGLEWAWRLAQEPWRLGRRYFVDDAAIVPAFARALRARREAGARVASSARPRGGR